MTAKIAENAKKQAVLIGKSVCSACLAFLAVSYSEVPNRIRMKSTTLRRLSRMTERTTCVSGTPVQASGAWISERRALALCTPTRKHSVWLRSASF